MGLWAAGWPAGPGTPSRRAQRQRPDRVSQALRKNAELFRQLFEVADDDGRSSLKEFNDARVGLAQIELNIAVLDLIYCWEESPEHSRQDVHKRFTGQWLAVSCRALNALTATVNVCKSL